MFAVTSAGYRCHMIGPQCWCGPEAQPVECDNCGRVHGIVFLHKDVMLRYDRRPRLAVFSR